MNFDRKLINELYRRFPKRPLTLDERNLRLLADYIVEDEGISLQEDRLVFTRMSADSPFREILLEHVHGVVDLGEHYAIVLHASIIFLDRNTLDATVHIREVGNGFFTKVNNLFRKKC